MEVRTSNKLSHIPKVLQNYASGPRCPPPLSSLDTTALSSLLRTYYGFFDTTEGRPDQVPCVAPLAIPGLVSAVPHQSGIIRCRRNARGLHGAPKGWQGWANRPAQYY